MNSKSSIPGFDLNRKSSAKVILPPSSINNNYGRFGNYIESEEYYLSNYLNQDTNNLVNTKSMTPVVDPSKDQGNFKIDRSVIGVENKNKISANIVKKTTLNLDEEYVPNSALSNFQSIKGDPNLLVARRSRALNFHPIDPRSSHYLNN